jgi:ABC-type Fe3+/spermidine/putrescine transport system ATPase subunit
LRRFVAEFNGHTNFIEAWIGPEVRNAQIAGAWASPRIRRTAPVRQQVLVSLRYERVEVLDPVDGILIGMLENEIHMGPALRRTVRVEAGVSVIPESSNTGVMQRFAVGERVGLRWAPGAALALRDWNGGTTWHRHLRSRW